MKKDLPFRDTLRKLHLRSNALVWIFLVIAAGVLFFLPLPQKDLTLLWGILGLSAVLNFSLSIHPIRENLNPSFCYAGLMLYSILLGIANYYIVGDSHLFLLPLNLVVIVFASFFYGLPGAFLMALLAGIMDWGSSSLLAGSLLAVSHPLLLRITIYLLLSIFVSSPGEEIRRLVIDKDKTIKELYRELSALSTKSDEVTDFLKELERSLRETRELLRKKELILGISQTLTQSLELKELLGGVLAKIREMVWFHTGGIFLFNPVGNELYLAQSLGAYEKELHKLLLPEAGLPAIACRTLNSLLVLDAVSDPRFSLFKQSAQIGSALFIPIYMGRTCFGCIALWHPQQEGFALEAVALLKSVAQEIAFAIRNAELYNQLNNRLNFSVTLWEASRGLAASLSAGIEVWEKALSEALQKILRLFNADSAIFYRYSEENHQLIPYLLQGLAEKTRNFLLVPLKDDSQSTARLLSSTFQIKDAQNKSEFPELREIARTAGAASLLWASLSGRKQRILGALVLFSGESLGWSKEELQWLDIFSSFFSITLENILLFYELISQRNRLQILVDNVPEGVLTTDNSGKILSWNAAAANITGWSFAEVAGKPCSQFIACQKEEGKLCEKFCPIKQSMISLSRVYSGFEDIGIRTKFKTEVPVAITAAPIFSEEGKLSGAIQVFRDITREKEIEGLREEFFAAITHDLKSPLSSIIGYVQLLKNPKLKEVSPEQKEFLDAIIRSSKTLQILIDNILENTRLKSGEFRYNPALFNIGAVLSEVNEIFMPLLSPKSLYLEIKAEPQLLVYADREKVKEVLINLISNAIEFSPEKGKVQVAALAENTKVKIVVKDEGSGIPEEKFPYIFEKFVKLEEGKKGTGLGLFIVKRLLQLHGEDIKVESQLGKGTSFCFALPQKKPEKKELKGRGDILIIESDVMISERLSQAALKRGFSPIRAYDFREARVLFKMKPPTLILADTEFYGEGQDYSGLRVNDIPILLLGEVEVPGFARVSRQTGEEELWEKIFALLKEKED